MIYNYTDFNVDKQAKTGYNISKRLGDGVEYQNENFNGEYDFRSNFHNGWEMSANLHEYSEILYCKNGEGRVIINGETINIKTHELVWIPPNYIHRFDCPNAEVICAVFSNDLIPLFFKALEGRHFRVSSVCVEELAYFLDGFHNLKKSDYLIVSGYLNLICAKVIKCSSFENPRYTDGVLYQKIISYVSENYTNDITLSQVAKMFGYNEKYLSYTLHDLTGVNFRQLLNFYRINHAKNLLSNSKNKNIGQIAMECGFGALNTFNREFKRVVGMTPRAYRNLI